MVDETSILIIYTGGTIGMIVDEESGALVPFNFDLIYEQIPVLKKFHFHLGFHSFDPIMDSSNMNPEAWIELASIIEKNYEEYDGFVVLHGSDTMAFSASALSFLLENLNKPVIFTGSQLPMGVLRTDGRENFITAIEIAAAKENNTPVVPEVCVYFENRLMRGNRTVKYNAENFNAFISGNYPLLAEVGVFIKYNENAIQKPNFKKLKAHRKMDTNVGILKLFPGITKQFVESVLAVPGLKGLVLETFGTGNAPADQWFLDLLKKAVNLGLLIINITQCLSGNVIQGKYETSKGLKEIGILSGHDMTTEAALVKMMYLFGEGHNNAAVKELMQLSLRGEVSLENQ
ncbi:MAG TPA: type I asparaginase [Bacteroidales bacterium]